MNLSQLFGGSAPAGIHIPGGSLNNDNINLISPRICHGFGRGAGFQDGVASSVAKDQSSDVPSYRIPFKQKYCGHMDAKASFTPFLQGYKKEGGYLTCRLRLAGLGGFVSALLKATPVGEITLK